MAAERTGARVRAIPVTDGGPARPTTGWTSWSPARTRVIAVTHASNVTGAVTEVGRLREAADAVGALLLLDGAQRAPHGPLDVQALGCDLYAFSGHKMFGPTGAGALWGREELLAELPPFLGGGEMIRRVDDRALDLRRRRRTASRPARRAIGAGASAWVPPPPGSPRWTGTRCGRQEIGAHRRGCWTASAACPACACQGPAGTQARLGVVSFSVEGVHPHDVCQLLDEDGVCLRGGHHCAQPLMDAFDLPATARASLAPYNDAADVDALLAGLERAIARLR